MIEFDDKILKKFRKIKITTCNCCVNTLTKLICKNFDEGDIIGITFIEGGVASIATGTFVKVADGVVVVDDLLLDDTTSFIPLCDVSSIEKGIPATATRNNTTLSVKLR